MAGDLDLTRVTAPLPGEAVKELTQQKTDNSPHWTEESFESEDVSSQKREAVQLEYEIRNVNMNNRLVIEQDDETGKFIQKIVDRESGEVIEQWPDEAFLNFARSIGKSYGVLIDKNV